MRRVARRWLPLLLLALPACRDKDEAPADLENLWPNADGSSWTYEYVERFIDPGAPPLYPTPADVPTVPTLQQLALELTRSAAEPFSTSEATYRIAFEGNVTTQSGVTAQHLVTSLEPIAAPRSPGAAGNERASALLARLWAARPDLRARLEASAPSLRTGPALRSLRYEPLFLDGYAWARTPDWIGGYGDVDQQPSWRYLEAELDPGHEFSLQLVPALTDDVWLHARVLGRRSVETPSGVFQDAVVCLYVVDFGISKVSNDSGVLLGYSRTYSFGTVAYAVGTGPVAGYEHPWIEAGDPDPGIRGDLTIGLVAKVLPR